MPDLRNQQDSLLPLLMFNISPHLAAAASWFLAFGADGSAATDFAVTSSLDDTMETFFKDTTICPCTSLSYNMNHVDIINLLLTVHAQVTTS
jgi:urocanate hydratase